MYSLDTFCNLTILESNVPKREYSLNGPARLHKHVSPLEPRKVITFPILISVLKHSVDLTSVCFSYKMNLWHSRSLWTTHHRVIDHLKKSKFFLGFDPWCQEMCHFEMRVIGMFTVLLHLHSNHTHLPPTRAQVTLGSGRYTPAVTDCCILGFLSHSNVMLTTWLISRLWPLPIVDLAPQKVVLVHIPCGVD